MQSDPLYPVELERAILGNLLLKEGATFPHVEELLRAESFGSRQHQVLWTWIQERYRNGKPASAEALIAGRAEFDLDQDFGGAAYLEGLGDRACLDSVLASHAEQVAGAAKARRLRVSLERTTEALARGHDDVDRVLAEHEQEVMRIASGASRVTSVLSIREVAAEAKSRSKRIVAGEKNLEFIRTGFPSLDKHYSGWPRGLPTALGGRPKMGKSTFMLSAVLRGASDRYGDGAVPQGIVSLEMKGRKLLYKLAETWSGVQSARIFERQASPEELDRWHESFDVLGEMPIWIDETVKDVVGVQSAVRRMARMHGCQVVYLDYFQLVKVSLARDGGNATAVLDQLSDGLRTLAKEEDIALVVISQLNQDCEKRVTGGRRGVPGPGDFRGTDKILQDAGLAAGVYREFFYHPPRKFVGGQYTEGELATLLQPVEFVPIGVRERAREKVELYVRLANGRVYDPLDPDFQAPEWTGRVGDSGWLSFGGS